MGMRGHVRDFDACQFGVEFVARFKDDQFGTGSQGQQDGAAVHDRPETTASATAASGPSSGAAGCLFGRSAPSGLPVPGVDAENFIALSQAVEQAVLEHWGVELDGLLRVAPKVFGCESIPSFLELHSRSTAARPGVDEGLSVHDWAGGIVTHSLRRERRLPCNLSVV